MPCQTRSRAVLLLLAGILLALACALLFPWNLPKLASQPHPAGSYNEALRRIDLLRKQEAALAINPKCSLQVMTHGQKSARTVILVHGYTSCPQQFYEIGLRFFERGDNVLIARLPHHGLSDRMNSEQSKLKAEELAAYADEVVDIGRGLGEKVVMMGISAGGVMTAWAAQNRNDIDLAVIISPAFGFKKIPMSLTAAVMNIYSLLPDSWSWWDEKLKENVLPPYGYPRYSKHALTEILRLGFVVEKAAKQNPPAAGKIVMVFNANDNSINNERTRQIVELWETHRAIGSYTFDASLKLGHDLIDPNEADQKVAIVHPKLIELCGE
jgi:pimeloyl-ACP methyl ester carboxylesterase